MSQNHEGLAGGGSPIPAVPVTLRFGNGTPLVLSRQVPKQRYRQSQSNIPDEMQEMIFDPFVQLGRSLTNTQEGAGLGLAISRDLARAMKGDVTVQSTPGSGSTFTLRLPAA